MNLKRYFLMFIICVSSFMIYTNNVKADTCDNVYISQLDSVYNRTSTFSGGTSYFDYTFPSSFNYNNNYDYMKFRIIWGYTNANGIISNIDFVTTCQGYNNYNNTSNGRITYGDGTTASISLMDYERVCSSWSTYLSSTTGGNITYSYQPNVNNVSVAFRVDNTYWHYCDVDSNGLVICKKPSSQQVSLNALRFMFGTNGSTGTLKYGVVSDVVQYCKSDSSTFTQINNNTQQINNNINDIKNDIKNDNIDDSGTSSSTSGWASKNASNGTITQLLTLPISLLTNITNSINSSCSSFSLGTLFDTELVLPCINLQDYLGSTLVSIIDILFSGFMIYNIAKKLIKIFNDFTNLKSNQIDEIYGGGNE